MKVIHSINFFKPSWDSGGPSRVAYELSREMVNFGHSVTVYTTDGYRTRLNVKKNTLIDVEGIDTYYFRNISSYLAKNFLLTIPYRMPSIIKKEIANFDILHIHEIRTIPGVISHHYAMSNHIPYVLQAHGAIPTCIGRQHLKFAFDLLFGSKMLKNASKFIAINDIEAQQYCQLGVDSEKIRIVPNGINISDYRNLPQKGEFKERYKISPNVKVVLYLGRLNKIKGLDFLLKAFSCLANDCSKVKLVIAGPDDGMSFHINNLISRLHLAEKVLLTGPIYDRAKLMAYVDADVLVYPSKYEIFGLVPLEAIMCGTPVIVTNGSGCGELIKKSNCGYLVEYNNEKNLVDTIKHVLTCPREAEMKVAIGQKYIRDNLNWNNITKSVLDIYEECYA